MAAKYLLPAISGLQISVKEKFIQLFNKRYSVPKTEALETAAKSFTPIERVVLYVFGAIFILCAFILLLSVNNTFLVQVPQQGGTLTEGIVGIPHFINPLFAVTDGEKDLSSLLYSGLMKPGPNGGLIPDLAKDYTVSDDGRIYTFTIKDNAFFHNGDPVTADDVDFTIKKATDPTLKSPRRANWEGVAVKVLGPKQIQFTLSQPYAPFLQSTTLGILPKHIWQNINDDQFSQLIELTGSGPYKLDSIARDSSGIPLSYTLTAFNEYTLGAPYIETLLFKFYSTEQAALDAYKNGAIESMGSLSPENVQSLAVKNSTIEHSPLPRLFGLFFNQNQAPVFTNQEVRSALNMVVDKDAIINKVLSGYGQAINGALPSGVLSDSYSPKMATADVFSTSTSTTPQSLNVEAAKKLLAKNGWTTNSSGILEKKVGKTTTQLVFSIYTSNTPELLETANIVKEEWESIGAKVTIKSFELGDLNEIVLRPRKYDVLLFGEVVGADLDLYSFWDSSQRNDPGLNISLYANSKVDKIVEQLRTTIDPTLRTQLLQNFQTAFNQDIPAIYIYSPDFIYIVPKKIQNFEMNELNNPSERFARINEWYINTERIWKIFVKN